MLRSASKRLVLGSVLAALFPPVAHSQQGAKLSGGQLREMLANETPWAGVNHASGCVFLVTGPADRRTQFYSCPNEDSDTVRGSQVVEGDMMCVMWQLRPKRCAEWYHVGGNKFEQKAKGSPAATHTIYTLK
jgi:hypothetical protein